MHCSRGKIGKGGDGRLDRKYDKLDNKLDSLLAQAYRVTTAEKFTEMLNKACLNIYNRLLDRYENGDDDAVQVEITRIQRWIRGYQAGGLALTLYLLSKSYELFSKTSVRLAQEYLEQARKVADRYVYLVHMAQGRLFEQCDVQRSMGAYINCIKYCQKCRLNEYDEDTAEDIKETLIISQYRYAMLQNMHQQDKSKINGSLKNCIKNTSQYLGKKHPILKKMEGVQQVTTKIDKTLKSIYRGMVNMVDGGNNLQGHVSIDYDEGMKHMVIEAKYENKGRKNKAQLMYPLELTSQKISRISSDLSWLHVRDWRITIDKQILNRLITGKITENRRLWLIDKSEIFAEDQSSDSLDSDEQEEQEDQQERPMKTSQAFSKVSKLQQSTVL